MLQPRYRRPLVGVTISAGLGNQMFQYAAALALSERLGAELRCDVSFFRGIDFRRLELGRFGVPIIACRDPVTRKPWHRLGVRLHLVPEAFRGATRFEDHGHFDPAFLALQAPCYISGFMQSWRYFEGHEQSVWRAFDPARLASDRTGAMAARIRAARNPVAVHVRRGDYAESPEAIAAFGLLHADYYNRGRAEIEARVERPQYFLFSDDIPAAMAELADWPELVPVTGLAGHEDLYLMSLCRHFIIASSTFSWWGAWLGTAPDKVVVAPSRWFGPEFKQRIVLGDRLPPGWTAVDPGHIGA
jgi:hypothetical protein